MAGSTVGPCLSLPATRPRVAGSRARPGPRGATFFPGLNLPLLSPFLSVVSTPSPQHAHLKETQFISSPPPPSPKPFQEPSRCPPLLCAPAFWGADGGLVSERRRQGREVKQKQHIPLPRQQNPPTPHIMFHKAGNTQQAGICVE